MVTERIVGEHGTEFVVPVKCHDIRTWKINGIITIPAEVPDYEHVDLKGLLGILEWMDVETLRKIFRQQNSHCLVALPEIVRHIDFSYTASQLKSLKESIKNLDFSKASLTWRE